MIRRIKNITNIGVFRDFKGGGEHPLADDNKISVIFGRNMLGKTTLAAIFDSLANNNPSLITERASIPHIATNQAVQLSYINKLGQTKTLDYKSSLWEQNDLFGRIYLFDQDFIHRNLITGTEITRENKEEFTNFILGEEGVKLSDEIETLKKNLRTKRSDLEKIRPPFAVKQQWDESTIREYATLQIDWSPEDLLEEKESIEKKLLRTEKAGEFIALPALSLLPIEALKNFENLQNDLNKMSELSYKTITDQAKNRVLTHIKDHCKNDEQATLWLKQGSKWITNKSCPFCSQKLDPVIDLVEVFKKMFDQAFEDYEANVQKSITEILNQLDRLMAFSPVTLVNNIVLNAKKYQPFLDDVVSDFEELEQAITKVQGMEVKIRELLNNYKIEVIKAINDKKGQPHNPIKISIDGSDLEGLYKDSDDLFTKVNLITKSLSKSSETHKKNVGELDQEQINQEKRQCNDQLFEIAKKQARIEESEACNKYSKLCSDIDIEAKTIQDKHEALEKEQSDYLSNYFNLLNDLFNQLGSKNFKLELQSSRRGDKKTFFLNVKYHNQTISPDQLCRVFGESDKRSLALAVFICKVKHIEEKEKAILILDDPVVSFDDNRVGQSVNIVKELARDFNQIILLTHYKLMIDKLYKSRAEANYLNIEQTPSGSVIKILDIARFTLTAHEKSFEKIAAFINGENSIDIRLSMRPFMEDHLKLIYAKQIHDSKINMKQDFKLVINELCKNGCFNEDTKSKLHNFRELLNPDHHTSPTDDNPEETRNNAANLFQLLYEGLN